MAIPIKSREATHLIEMAIWAAKQDNKMFDMDGIPRMDKARAVLLSGLTMVNNKSAISNTASTLNVGEDSAFKLLQQMQSAAIQVAQKYNFVDLVELAKRRSV